MPDECKEALALEAAAKENAWHRIARMVMVESSIWLPPLEKLLSMLPEQNRWRLFPGGMPIPGKFRSGLSGETLIEPAQLAVALVWKRL